MLRILSRLFRVGLLLLLLVTVALFLWAWRGRLLEDLVEKAASAELGLTVQVGSLDVQYPRGFALSDVRVLDPETGDCSATVDEIVVQVESLPAGPVQSVVLKRPDVVLHEDEQGIPLLDAVLAKPASGLTRIHLVDGRVRLTGDGPVVRRLRQAIEPDTPIQLDVPLLDAVPRTDGRTVDVSAHLVAVGVLELDLVAELSLDGTARGELRIDEARPLELDHPELRARLAPEAVSLLDRNGLRGPVALRLLGEFDGERPRFEAFLDLLGVAVTPSAFPASLRDLRGGLHWRDGRVQIEDVDATLEGSMLNVAGVLEDLGGDAEVHLTLGIRHGRMTDELRAAVALDPHGAEFLDLFQPSGTFNAVTRVEYRVGQTPRVWLEVEILDGAACYRGELDPATGRRDGFPLPVTGVHGLARIEPERVRFSNLVGRSESGAIVSGTGDFELVGDDLRGTFDLTASNLALDQDFQDACVACAGDRAAEVFRLAGLSGTADFEFHYEAKLGDAVEEWEVRIRPRQVNLRPVDFPYPVVLDAGLATLDENRFEAFGLRGRPAHPDAASNAVFHHGQVELDGRATLGGGPFQFTLRASEVPLAEPLRKACVATGNERLVDVWQHLQPGGEIGARMEWRRTSEDPEERIELELHPKDVSLTLPGISFPFHDVSGTVNYARVGDEPGMLRTQPGVTVQARLLGGLVYLQGEMSDLGQGKLTLRAERLRLRSQAIQAEGEERDVVSAVRSVSEEAAELLEVLRPNGRIRARCELLREGEEWHAEVIEVAPDLPAGLVRNQPNGVSLSIPNLPARVLWYGGSIQGRPMQGEWKFEELRGNLGDAELALRDGEFLWGEDHSEIRCTGTFGAVPLHTVLFSLLGADNRNLLKRWEVGGLTHSTLQELFVTIPRGTTTPSAFHMTANLDLSRCALKAGAGFEELNGRVEVNVDHQADRAFQTEVRGQLRDASLGFKGLRFHELNSALRMVDDTLYVDGLEAEFAGGRLPVELNRWRFPLDGTQEFDGLLTFRGVELDRLFGVDNVRTRGWEGVIEADVTVRGRGLELSELKADGTVGVREGQLWEIPVFERLYDLGISRILGQSERPKFEEGEVQLSLREGVMHLTDLRLQGPSLALFGEGALGPSGLDLHLFPLVSVDIPFVDIPLLGPALESLLSLVERETLSFRFEGPYQSPRVRWDPVSARPRSNFAEGLDRPRIASPGPYVPTDRF